MLSRTELLKPLIKNRKYEIHITFENQFQYKPQLTFAIICKSARSCWYVIIWNIRINFCFSILLSYHSLSFLSADTSIDIDLHSTRDLGAELYPNGTVDWSYPIITQTSCLIDARLFPFDTQYCSLRFGSWAYNIDQLNLEPISKITVGKYFMENGIWKMDDILVERVVTHYGGAGWVCAF